MPFNRSTSMRLIQLRWLTYYHSLYLVVVYAGRRKWLFCHFSANSILCSCSFLGFWWYVVALLICRFRWSVLMPFCRAGLPQGRSWSFRWRCSSSYPPSISLDEASYSIQVLIVRPSSNEGSLARWHPFLHFLTFLLSSWALCAPWTSARVWSIIVSKWPH
jgi:hypothetical protein